MKSSFTTGQILKIRYEWDAGIIDCRAWADALRVSPETIRRVGRRDTHRHLATENAQPLQSQRTGYVREEQELPAAVVQASLERTLALLGKDAPQRAPLPPLLPDDWQARLAQEAARTPQAANAMLDALGAPAPEGDALDDATRET